MTFQTREGLVHCRGITVRVAPLSGSHCSTYAYPAVLLIPVPIHPAMLLSVHTSKLVIPVILYTCI
nr:hypothetical protein Q903MT_gene3649 [Picea sitchensis]